MTTVLPLAIVEPDLVVAVQDLEAQARHARLDLLDRRAVPELRGAEVGPGTGSEDGRREDGQDERTLHARRLPRKTAAAMAARATPATRIQIQVLLPLSSSLGATVPTVVVVVAGGGGGGGGRVRPVAAVSVTREPACPTTPRRSSARPSRPRKSRATGRRAPARACSGNCALNWNLPSAPCGILPPDHETRRPLTECLQPWPDER